MNKILLKIYKYLLIVIKFLAIFVAVTIMMIDDAPVNKLIIALFVILPVACLVAYTVHLAVEKVDEMISEVD